MLTSEFKRKFSVSMNKNKKIMLGEMSFYTDFINSGKGDLYPPFHIDESCTESVTDNTYQTKGGCAKRLFCQFFPFASYEIEAFVKNGSAGFEFDLCGKKVSITAGCNLLYYHGEEGTQEISLGKFASEKLCMIVSCRPGAFDIYFKKSQAPEFFMTFYEKSFEESNVSYVFQNSYAILHSENSTVLNVHSYIDNGIGIADIRPIKYENGEVIYESGKVFFTASIRMQEKAFQGVFSWIPGTADIGMTGAVFYDCGDSTWRNYVAPTFVYDRMKGMWYVWVSSFEHKHILAYCQFDSDVRYGVNVLDVNFMTPAGENSKFTDFVGFRGDEDPDVYYDEAEKMWYMAICRINPETKAYAYVFFKSENPFDGYTYIGRGPDGSETGGVFVKDDDGMCFVCGNGTDTSCYRIYSKDGMTNASFNHPDGGFRAWGGIFPIKQGTRKRTYWLTFDRHQGSEYTWSYGNMYCFEL